MMFYKEKIIRAPASVLANKRIDFYQAISILLIFERHYPNLYDIAALLIPKVWPEKD